MKCSNIHCPHGNYDEHATVQCDKCKRRGQSFWKWLDNQVIDSEAERIRKKREQDNRHKKGEEE